MINSEGGGASGLYGRPEYWEMGNVYTVPVLDIATGRGLLENLGVHGRAVLEWL
jgi:hypothetical protein